MNAAFIISSRIRATIVPMNTMFSWRWRAVGVLLSLFSAATGTAVADAVITPSGDMRIPKKEISSIAQFYAYKAGNVRMEVLALRAPDGTVRTAFNTCQVCYASGRGYYTQKGDVLVCNNCGNRFPAGQVELVKGGCNPMPITKDLKTEDADTITIPKAVFEEAKPFFLKWKR
jgi:hypothetical protein